MTIQALQGIFKESAQSDGFSAATDVSMLQQMEFILQACPLTEQGQSKTGSCSSPSL